MKAGWIAGAIGAALFSVAAWAQMGPGMMGGGGYGMGPGMMGGGGTGGCPMMGQGGGYGRGGMMGGGMGGGGMMGGRGMMGGAGPWAYESLNLSAEQREKVAKITDELREKQWGLMRSMHELRWKFRPGTESDADALKNFDAMTAVRREMFAARLDARKRIDEVLTKEQREELTKQQRRGGW
ncbi:MAG TPA: Spy/CpxP family protein refolding chaperone [Usitatibacter sp.]|nr:Spy/CpxP family protein refolding chaperone [Usitatibacter sp.]